MQCLTSTWPPRAPCWASRYWMCRLASAQGTDDRNQWPCPACLQHSLVEKKKNNNCAFKWGRIYVIKNAGEKISLNLNKQNSWNTVNVAKFQVTRDQVIDTVFWGEKGGVDSSGTFQLIGKRNGSKDGAVLASEALCALVLLQRRVKHAQLSIGVPQIHQCALPSRWDISQGGDGGSNKRGKMRIKREKTKTPSKYDKNKERLDKKRSKKTRESIDEHMEKGQSEQI